MPNTFTGLNNDILSNAVLESFVQNIIAFTAFSVNLSGDAAQKGDKISVLRIGAQAAAVPKVAGEDYVMQGTAADSVEIALNQHEHVSAFLSDIERANSSLLEIEKFGKAKGYQLAKKVFQTVLGHVTAARYGAAVHTGLAADFTSDDVIDIRTACSGVGMPKDSRALILDDTYFGNLLKDNSIKNAANFGSAEALREGKIGRMSGFDMYETGLIPDNEENLVGIAAHPSGLALAMRYLDPGKRHTYANAYALTDAATGLTIGTREGYDQKAGVEFVIWEALFGFELGIADGIKRIVSAAVV